MMQITAAAAPAPAPAKKSGSGLLWLLLGGAALLAMTAGIDDHKHTPLNGPPRPRPAAKKAAPAPAAPAPRHVTNLVIT